MGSPGYAAAARALSLVLPGVTGVRRDEPSISWTGVHAFARRERLISLAWHRSSAEIAAWAPAPIAAEWRAEAVAALGAAIRRTAELGALLDVLEPAGVAPIVLKGVPFSVRLYGSGELRPSADVDLFIAERGRATADTALVGAGWMHLSGEAPREGLYALDRAGMARLLLEVHSSLTDDALLAHLRPPAPQARSIEVDGRQMPALAGDFLPAYVAVQLAKHAASPLLWLLDFATLWKSLSDDERRQAAASAQAAGAARFLRWAIGLSEALPAGAAGEPRALHRIGVMPDGRVSRGHNAWRVAALTEKPLDQLAVIRSWAWPNAEGRGREFLARRVSGAVGRLTRAATSGRSVTVQAAVDQSSSALPADARSVDGTGLIDAVRSIVADAGGALWIRAYGKSMQPAVPNGARVHLVPVRPADVRRGAVVFAVADQGALVHRVVARWGDRVVLQGDGMAWSDPPLRRHTVLAAVDAVEIEGRAVPMAARPLPSRSRRLRRLPRQLAVLCGIAVPRRLRVEP